MRVLAFLVGLAVGDEIDDALFATLRETPGVKQLDDGLMYKVIRKGNGTKHPGWRTKCWMHYAGQFLREFMDNSTREFDSSYFRKRAIEIKPKQTIPGWAIIMQKMVQGDKIEAYIPSGLGYAERGAGGQSLAYGIPPDTALKYTIELIRLGKGQKLDLEHEL